MKQWNIYSTKKRKRQLFFSGVEYKAYDKEYPDEALDNDEYDKKMMKSISLKKRQ